MTKETGREAHLRVLDREEGDDGAQDVLAQVEVQSVPVGVYEEEEDLKSEHDGPRGFRRGPERVDERSQRFLNLQVHTLVGLKFQLLGSKE